MPSGQRVLQNRGVARCAAAVEGLVLVRVAVRIGAFADRTVLGGAPHDRDADERYSPGARHRPEA